MFSKIQSKSDQVKINSEGGFDSRKDRGLVEKVKVSGQKRGGMVI